MSPIVVFILRQFPAWILRASWQGAALALLVIIVQRLLGARLAARWRNALWLLVFARLLIPTLPQARISAYNLLPTAPPVAILPAAPHLFEESQPASVDTAMLRMEPRFVGVAPFFAPPPRFHIPSLPYLWLAGTFVIAAWSLTAHLRIRKRIARLSEDVPAHLLTEFAFLKRQLRIRRADLIISKAVPTPFVTGLWKAHVILPAGIEKQSEPAQIRMVLLHELAHIKRGDLWLAWLGWLAAVIHWFNPGVFLALSLARKDREMACDEWVLHRTSDAKGYGLALLHFLKQAQATSPISTPGTIGIVEGRAALFERMGRIATWHRPTLFSSIAGFTLLVVIGAFTLTGAATKITPLITIPLPPQESLIRAIFQDDPAMAKLALKEGAKPDIETEFANREILDRSTPVCLAAEQGRLDLIRLFVTQGANLKPGRNSWSTPIDVALRNNFPAIAVFLHDHGATTDPLIYAAGSGDLDQVNKLTASGKPKTLNDAAGLAAASGQTATLSVLLAKGADPKNAFHRAAYAGSVDSMRFLLSHGVDIQKEGYDSLGITAYRDHPAAVTFLLQQHVNPNRQKQPTDTPLTEINPPLNMAASGGSLACVKLLLDAGADPDSVVVTDPGMGNAGSTPIDEACGPDNAEIVRLLLDHGARLDFVDSRGFTPVLHAAYSHAPQCLALLIDRGADIKAYNLKWKCGIVDFAAIFDGEDDDRPDMHDTVARVNCDMATLQVLLDRGIINANSTSSENFSLLSAAVTNGQTAWTEKLLQMGAKVNTIDNYGGTPLTRAITSTTKEPRYFTVINELLAKGADPNTGNDNPLVKQDSVPSALKAAISGPKSREVRRKTVHILLARGARFSVSQGSDAEKILLAATAGDMDAVNKLIARGVSPNVADAKGWTPLLSAAALGFSPVLKALIAAGADVNAHDAAGLNPLAFTAASYPDLTDFHLLLDKGANVNSESTSMFSGPVIFLPIMEHDPTLLRDLLNHGANPNPLPGSPDNRFTPLEAAVQSLSQDFKDQKRQQIVTMLLAAGADPNPNRSYSKSLLYYPVMNNETDMVAFLLKAGIDPKKDPDHGKALAEALARHGNKEMKSLVGAVLARNDLPSK